MARAHDIYFCGEKIPMDDKFVVNKLMNIIRQQFNYINFPALRKRINEHMPKVEEWLRATSLPQDFKYLAIVESGFKNDAQSGVGALGFWQLMKPTARDWGLSVDGPVDERTDFDKCTYAACLELARNYSQIRRSFGISSWVLTAAAFNVGVGQIKKTISRDGANYFTMRLNDETAAYVYKIIAIKELYEYPELYMKGFGYNVFTTPPDQKKTGDNSKTGSDLSGFGAMKVDVNAADGLHPENIKQGLKKNSSAVTEEAFYSITGKISGKYKKIADGDNIDIELDDDLNVTNRFFAKGSIIKGRAWIIDDRVMIDLGFDHDVILFDKNDVKGIPLKKVKNKLKVIIKISKDP
ncbi:MAG: lytic transglycosylase domain-containing protein [Chitinophagaceae bacterium]|nr:lytic transglycosylase domain-containing protein [Chitinophagaceae bacterium]